MTLKSIFLTDVNIIVILSFVLLVPWLDAQEKTSAWDGLALAAKQRLTPLMRPEEFNRLNIHQRASLACVTQHLEIKGLLGKIKSISHVSKQGGIFAKSRSLKDFWQSLEKLDFTTNYRASRKNQPGLREGNSGVGLHIINFHGDNLDIHLDLHNPGSYKNASIPIFSMLFHASSHIIADLINWRKRNAKQLLRKHKQDHCGLSQQDIQSIEK